MSIRQKTLLIIAATLVGLIGLLYASSRRILLQSFQQLEESSVRRSVQRAQSAIDADRDDLARVAAAWARQDDLAALVDAPDSAALSDTTFDALRLSALLLLDANGALVYGAGYDLLAGARQPLPPGLAAWAQSGAAGSAGAVSGILKVADDPLLVAVAPLGGATPDGTLILGRALSAREVRRLADEFDVLMSVHALDPLTQPDDVRAARPALDGAGAILVRPQDSHVVAGYALLSDLAGQPVLILKTSLSRDIYEQGQVSIWYFMLALVASGVVFGVMILLLLEVAALARLRQLSAGVSRIGRRSDPSIRVQMRGRDEVAQLARAIDGMLAALEQAQAAERSQRVIAEALRDSAAALTGTLTLDEVLERILTNVGRVVPYDSASLMLVEGDTLRLAGGRRLAAEGADGASSYRYAEFPLLLEALRAERPALLADTRADVRWEPLPGVPAETRSWIGAPLAAHGVIIGFLSAASRQPDAYTPADLEAVGAFAQQAALAVQNARILSELEASVEELRRAQAHLLRTTRLSTAGQIAAGVAHQINNPLTTILAESHLLLQAAAEDDPDAESLQAIRDAARRAGAVVGRLLDLTHTHTYEMAALDVNASLQSAVALVRAQIAPHAARLDLDLAPDLPPVRGSAIHLEDVWINLLINARDAVSGVAQAAICVASRRSPDGAAVEVTVQDNGRGIPAESLAHIFEPFYTTKVYGTGLGLSICQDIVAQHGGTLRVASSPDAGTRLTVCLPLAGPPEEAED